jgi:hypothetical protein
VDIVGSRIKCRANKASFLLTEVCLRHSLLWVGSGLSLSKFLEPSITLEQRSVRWLLQKSCGFENQRVAPYFLSIPEFAYTFTYTPTLTTRRAPVYSGLPWASALIILWSQVQVLVGPPEKQTLISNGGGFVF